MSVRYLHLDVVGHIKHATHERSRHFLCIYLVLLHGTGKRDDTFVYLDSKFGFLD